MSQRSGTRLVVGVPLYEVRLEAYEIVFWPVVEAADPQAATHAALNHFDDVWMARPTGVEFKEAPPDEKSFPILYPIPVRESLGWRTQENYEQQS